MRRRRRVRSMAVGALLATALAAVACSNAKAPSSATGSGAVSASPLGHAASTPPPTSSTSPPSTAAPDATFTITAVGDTMLGYAGNLPPDPASYFAAIRDELAGDVVFANLEGTLTDKTSGDKCAGATPGNCFAFSVPPSFAQHLASGGFTILNDANNHFYDFGSAGANDTVAAIHAAGMVQTGLPGEVTVVQAGAARVAFIGFGPYDGMASLLDPVAARALIGKARSEADVVVVYMHAGAEGSDAQHVTGAEETYLGEDRGNPQSFAHLAIDSGASLVLASGPHVLRGAEFYKGHLVAYSLGNFAGYGNFSRSGVLAQSAILRVTLDANGGFRDGRFVATTFADKGRPVRGGDGVATIARLSTADFGSDAATVARDGTITPP